MLVNEISIRISAYVMPRVLKAVEMQLTLRLTDNIYGITFP